MGTVTALPRGKPLVRADLDAMPDDGHRYELVDGSLVVTPAPTPQHQGIVTRLLVLLDAACPADLSVLTAPLDVALNDNTVVQPDLLVAPRSAFTDRDLPTAPLLAVEILSPSTRHIDRDLKRRRYEVAGCQSYWVVDPEMPSLTVWELDHHRYTQRAHVTGSADCTLTMPFPATIVPARLLD